jgi:hypothetical protein
MAARKRPADDPEYVDIKLAQFREFLMRQPSFLESAEWQVVFAVTGGDGNTAPPADETWLRTVKAARWLLNEAARQRAPRKESAEERIERLNRARASLERLIGQFEESLRTGGRITEPGRLMTERGKRRRRTELAQTRADLADVMRQLAAAGIDTDADAWLRRQLEGLGKESA